MAEYVFRKGVSIGRFKFSLLILKHVYATSSDRWVIQPEIIYDRKKK